MAIRCGICRGFVPEVEIYGDWYYCSRCMKSIPITLPLDIPEKRDQEFKKSNSKIIAENIFDED